MKFFLIISTLISILILGIYLFGNPLDEYKQKIQNGEAIPAIYSQNGKVGYILYSQSINPDNKLEKQNQSWFLKFDESIYFEGDSKLLIEKGIKANKYNSNKKINFIFDMNIFSPIKNVNAISRGINGNTIPKNEFTDIFHVKINSFKEEYIPNSKLRYRLKNKIPKRMFTYYCTKKKEIAPGIFSLSDSRFSMIHSVPCE